MTQGLDKAALLPVRTGYLEATAGVSSLSGPFARPEAGARLAPAWALFGFAQATPRERMAGVGARFTF